MFPHHETGYPHFIMNRALMMNQTHWKITNLNSPKFSRSRLSIV